MLADDLLTNPEIVRSRDGFIDLPTGLEIARVPIGSVIPQSSGRIQPAGARATWFA